ncbi:MAG: TolC family protein [Planctomycetaceae bacterium]|nr:TolC family protein [Planctomycetaceae bacterium]
MSGCAINLPTPRHPQASLIEPSRALDANSANEAQQTTEKPTTEQALTKSLQTRSELEQWSLKYNSEIQRLGLAFEAATAKTRYVDSLPDPKIGVNFFGRPIETATGSQRGNISLSQMIPWVETLDAKQQLATLQALAAKADYRSARLHVLEQVRVGWFRMYLIEQQFEVTKNNQQTLQSLIDVANSLIAAERGSSRDVLLGTLELTKLEERLTRLQQQRTSQIATLNQLLNRPIDSKIVSPEKIVESLPAQSQEALVKIALQSQPDIQAARLRNQAKKWGVTVAQLRRRPDVTVMASYFITDDNRAPNPSLKVGEDPWFFGLQVSIPIWDKKYNALEEEAKYAYDASTLSIETLTDRTSTVIVQLLAEIGRADETAILYTDTIIPQAQQTLETDQSAYANGEVGFDRLIRDFRSLLMLQLGYHQAIADRAIAVAELQRVIGESTPLLD